MPSNASGTVSGAKISSSQTREVCRLAPLHGLFNGLVSRDAAFSEATR